MLVGEGVDDTGSTQRTSTAGQGAHTWNGMSVPQITARRAPKRWVPLCGRVLARKATRTAERVSRGAHRRLP